MRMSGLQAFVEAAREMADAIHGHVHGSDRRNFPMETARVAFSRLDHPDCPHKCIAGVVVESNGYYGTDPCPIHGGEK